VAPNPGGEKRRGTAITRHSILKIIRVAFDNDQNKSHKALK
jgi:hypothetical protein